MADDPSLLRAAASYVEDAYGRQMAATVIKLMLGRDGWGND